MPNFNTMSLVWCPLRPDSPVWANSTKDRDYRCCNCGAKGHARAR